MTAAHLRHVFLYVYMFGIDNSAQAQHQTKSVPGLDVKSMQKLPEMVHQGKAYADRVKALENGHSVVQNL